MLVFIISACNFNKIGRKGDVWILDVKRSRKEVIMPHSCIGAISYYHHSFVDYATSEEAKRMVEATAAGTAIYHAIWKSLKTVLLSVVVIIVASLSVTKLDITDAALFAHRMRPCLYPPMLKLPSPEPVKNSPKRDASLGSGNCQASNCAAATCVKSSDSSST